MGYGFFKGYYVISEYVSIEEEGRLKKYLFATLRTSCLDSSITDERDLRRPRGRSGQNFVNCVGWYQCNSPKSGASSMGVPGLPFWQIS